MMRLAINNTFGRGRPAPLPAWRRGLTPLQWSQIGGNTLSSVDPTANALINPNHPSTAPWALAGRQQDITLTWSGAAWDELRQRLWILGGGHSGYNGNEPYGIDVDVDSPLWKMYGYPTGSIQRPVASCVTRKVGDTEMMQDGRPFTTHTYNLLTVLDSGRLLQGWGGYAFDGNGTAAVEYDPSVEDWDVSTGRYALSGVTPGVRGGLVYDPVRDVCWSLGGQIIVKYNPSTMLITSAYRDYSGAASYGPFRYMPDQDLFVHFSSTSSSFGTGKHVLIFDPSTPGTAPVGINATTQAWGLNGVAYDTRRKRFLSWNGGGSVDTLTPPLTSPKTNAWTYGSLATSTAIVTPSAANTNGTYGRFQYSEKYDCCFALNLTSERLYVLPLS